MRLEDLGLIGNCQFSALVERTGDVVWCCLPRFDGDPVFHALLDSPAGCGDEGSYGVEIENHVRSEQAYDEGTAILRTRLFAASGDAVEVCDFAPRFFSRGRAFRPAMLVRRVRPLRGHPRIRIALQPRFDAGRVEPEVARGSHHLRFAGWTLDLAARQLVAPDGVVVALSGAEFRLLSVFAEHPNRVLDRNQLMDLTVGRDGTPYDRSIDVQVSRLRVRLRDDAREPRIIKTVRNEGYVLAAVVERLG